MNPCFSKCDDVGFVVVGEVVECGNMFRDEYGAGIVGADEDEQGSGSTSEREGRRDESTDRGE